MSITDAVMTICIDGPARGRLRAIESKTSYFHAYDDPPLVSAKQLDSSSDITFSALTYHVYKIPFMGFIIRVASMRRAPGEMDPYDIISCLFNEAGRQATYRDDGSAT